MNYTVFGSEKAAVVLDLGTAYLRVGFSQEAKPRHFLATSDIFVDPDGVPLKFVAEYGEQLPSFDEWTTAAESAMHTVFFKKLQCNPRERRVIVCEDILLPHVVRRALGHVLFTRFGVLSVLFLPTPVAALFPMEISTALVLDVGHNHTRVVPVYNLQVLIHALSITPVAGALVDTNLNRLLIKFASEVPAGDAEPDLSGLPSFEEDAGLNEQPEWPARQWPVGLLEDIKVRMCYVPPGVDQVATEDGEDPTSLLPGPGDVPAFAVPVPPANRLYVAGCVRALAGDMLFQHNNEREFPSVAEAVLDSLKGCALDLRGVMSKNIYVIGGTAMMPGFTTRLEHDLVRLVEEDPRYTELAAFGDSLDFHTAPFGSNYVAWVGASIYGSLLDYVAAESVTLEDYLETNRLPDWGRLTSNGGNVSDEDDACSEGEGSEHGSSVGGTAS